MASVSLLLLLLLKCCAILALPLVLLKCLLNKYRNGLSDIPGPTWAAYTGLWRLYNVSKGQAHHTSIALHRKYGKLVRLAPNVVSVGDGSEISRIYSAKGNYTKTDFYPIQSITWHRKPRPNLFSQCDEREHREQKRKIANNYTLESLLKMEPAIDGCSRLLLDKMHDYAKRGEALDLGTWLQYYTFDVVGEVTFAKKLGFLELGADVDGIIAAIEGMLLYGSYCGQVPEWHPRLLGNPYLPVLLPGMEQWNEVLNFTLKAINTRTAIAKDGELVLEEGRVGHDMLSRLAAAKSLDPSKISTADIVVATSGNVFAGSDTTAIALRAILYYLMKNPGKMQKLQAEIDEADKAGLLSNPIQDKEARQLPYLQAVEKEAMRLHPSVGLLLERHVPKGGAIICNHFIPEDTIVGINPWVLHYDADVFPDPEAFHPERWLDAAPDKLAGMEKHFFNFGAGNRMCTGRNLSLIEMRKLVPQLLREFDLSLRNGEEWKVSNVWFTQQKMPLCVLKRRE